MQLSDRSIYRLVLADPPLIAPFGRRHLQPGTYDCHLGPILIRPRVAGHVVSLRERLVRADERIDLRMAAYHRLLLRPGEFVLGSTIEYFRIPAQIQGRMDGKSSIGRDGLIVHATAAVFDAGFEGVGVVELKNISETETWELYYDEDEPMPIGQMTFTWLDDTPQRLYNAQNNHYQFQDTTVPSRLGGR